MKSKARVGCIYILTSEVDTYKVMRVFFHLRHPRKSRLSLLLSSKPRMKEEKALDKEWVVNRQRAISTGKVVASIIFPGFCRDFRHLYQAGQHFGK